MTLLLLRKMGNIEDYGDASLALTRFHTNENSGLSGACKFAFTHSYRSDPTISETLKTDDLTSHELLLCL